MMYTLTRRNPLWVVASLSILLLVAATLALLLHAAWWLLALAAALALAGVGLGTSAPQTARTRRSTAARAALPTPREQRLVYTDGGYERPALVVSGSGDEQVQMVLTTDGYALVDTKGRIIHRLK